MRRIAGWVNAAIDASDQPQALGEIRKEVLRLAEKFPLYPQLSE
jgi:glycine/serine hydroxymethyltransferase